jgi:hypothetical protein
MGSVYCTSSMGLSPSGVRAVVTMPARRDTGCGRAWPLACEPEGGSPGDVASGLLEHLPAFLVACACLVPHGACACPEGAGEYGSTASQCTDARVAARVGACLVWPAVVMP